MSEQASAFLASFAVQKNEISKGIEQKADFKHLLLLMTTLRKEFAEATSILPAYDLRQCELQLKAVEQQIDVLRTSTPKSRFAFKRSAAAPKVPESPASPSVPDTVSTPTQGVPSSQLSISGRSKALLTIKSLDSAPSVVLPQTSLSLSNLESCVVNLLPIEGDSQSFGVNALHIRGLKRVILVSGYIDGSVLIHDCEDCLLVLACRQFRMHTSKRTFVQLYVMSRPVIEHCKLITFGPYRPPPGANNPLPSEPSQHTSVQDFDWIKSSPSPNWTSTPSDTDANRSEELWSRISGDQSESAGDAASIVDELLRQYLPSSV